MGLLDIFVRKRASAHIARERLSTVYMPGRKITMLPEPVIAAFSLAEGTAPPALSLYAEVRADGSIVRQISFQSPWRTAPRKGSTL